MFSLKSHRSVVELDRFTVGYKLSHLSCLLPSVKFLGDAVYQKSSKSYVISQSYSKNRRLKVGASRSPFSELRPYPRLIIVGSVAVLYVMSEQLTLSSVMYDGAMPW